MAVKADKPFEKLVVQYDAGSVRTSAFSIDDAPGSWIDPYYNFLSWSELLVYGVADTENELASTSEIPLEDVYEDAVDAVSEDGFTSAILMGRILGCHIPISLITNLDADPYNVCDAEDANLEELYSVLEECKENEDFEDWIDDIYYIHAIDIEPEYQGCGYETKLLLQLPAIIVKTLHVFPSLLMHNPMPTQFDEPEPDLDAEAVLMHRQEYIMQRIMKDKSSDNVVLFPPKRPVPEREINRFLGRRNPGKTVPEAYRNQYVYKQYEAAGFKEAGQTGWLYKCIYSIYTKDGFNH